MRTIMTITIFSLTIFLQFDKSIAQEINLCLNNAEQYAAIVNSRDDCLEDETWMKISGGKDLENKKKYTPLLEIVPNQDCNTEGVVRTIGFDQNNNGSLDQSEIETRGSDCIIEPEE